MASTLDDAFVFLIDNFGPIMNSHRAAVADAALIVYGTTQLFPLGSSITVEDATNGGLAILRYMKIAGGTEGDANGMAAKDVLGLLLSTKNAYTLSPDGGEVMLNGPIAVALGTITGAAFTGADQYGWVWTGGVCPVDTVAGLGGKYVTDGNVAAESGMDMVDESGPISLGLLAAADVGIPSAFALSADA